ncbi:hypothetical protein M1L60_15155 [Actinoplanes sp. TRM 88003]|uniref:Uncharacterized protein n=1 Tax=Paractinoplanes aksuensis TaxID=2939490 RepID=A0ABT1DQD5_9ACTN|nr:hypothetical protein [Actinoplanes aksuensis]MCO8271931.1 hypothetical protein [Actinoplanes aksuensis]
MAFKVLVVEPLTGRRERVALWFGVAALLVLFGWTGVALGLDFDESYVDDFDGVLFVLAATLAYRWYRRLWRSLWLLDAAGTLIVLGLALYLVLAYDSSHSAVQLAVLIPVIGVLLGLTAVWATRLITR